MAAAVCQPLAQSPPKSDFAPAASSEVEGLRVVGRREPDDLVGGEMMGAEFARLAERDPVEGAHDGLRRRKRSGCSIHMTRSPD